MSHLRVLVINGGGVRGIVPARILDEISVISKKNITDLFDYIIGTSIGGIEAIALTVPGEDGKPKYTTKDVVDIMLNNAQEIFPQKAPFALESYTSVVGTGILAGIMASPLMSVSMGAGIGTGIALAGVGGLLGAIAASSYYGYHAYYHYGYEEGLLNALYSREGIDGLLDKKFGNTTLSETIIPIATVSYSLDKKAPKIWSTFKALENPAKYNYYVKDAGGATSAAPTYFPYKTTIAPDGTEIHDIDGGIFANSPTFLGIYELLKYKPSFDAHNLIVVSIGTGKFISKDFDHNVKPYLGDGKLGWVSLDGYDLISKMMEATEYADVVQSGSMFKAMRINPKLEQKFAPLDMGSPEHMQAFLNAIETTFIADHRGMLEQVVQCLESQDVHSIHCAQARKSVKEYAPEDFQYDNLIPSGFSESYE